MWSEVFLKNGLSFLENEPLARHTSIGVGGAASVFLEPANADELIFAIDLCLFHRIPFRVLGRGTNVVASDTLKTEVVISTRKLHSLQKCGAYITAECGTPLRQLANFALSQGLVGFAGLLDIPGSVGAAIRTNAGAFGDSVCQYLVSVKVYDAAKRRVRSIPAAALSFQYRSSAFLRRNDLFLLAADFGFPEGDVLREKARIRECRIARAKTQPVAHRSFGSVFRRHEGVGAGFYLEKAGQYILRT